MQCDLIDRYPIPRRLLPRIQERPPDRLMDQEVEAVTKVPEPYGFVVRLALGTGMRWGELTRVKSSDIRDGILTIHHTKSGKVRRVPLPPELIQELRTRVGKLVAFSSPGQFNTRVRILSQVWRFHAHQLRHTFACRWIERGGSLAALQQLLGHSSIVTTGEGLQISASYFSTPSAQAISPQTDSQSPQRVILAGAMSIWGQERTQEDG